MINIFVYDIAIIYLKLIIWKNNKKCVIMNKPVII